MNHYTTQFYPFVCLELPKLRKFELASLTTRLYSSPDYLDCKLIPGCCNCLTCIHASEAYLSFRHFAASHNFLSDFYTLNVLLNNNWADSDILWMSLDDNWMFRLVAIKSIVPLEITPTGHKIFFTMKLLITSPCLSFK